MSSCPLLIIGSGFGGSILALIALRLGYPVVLIEKGRHPRFAIGESSTPLTNLILEQIARDYDLPFLATLSKWGSWRKHHPELRVGLKRGFSFFHHQPGMEPDRDHPQDWELLVAASPHNQIADTHWHRSDFDAFLAEKAVAAGVDLRQDTVIEDLQHHPMKDRVEVKLNSNGFSSKLTVNRIIDASGPRGALHRLLGLASEPFSWMPNTDTLLTHFKGVKPWTEVINDTYQEAPYPPDSAAVHHIFPSGWCWILRFDNDLASCGVVMKNDSVHGRSLAKGALGWSSFLENFPALQRTFASATPVEPWYYQAQLPWRSKTLCGPYYTLLPSAFGFLDPILSTGFPLTLLGVQRLARTLQDPVRLSHWPQSLDEYERDTRRELAWTEKLVAALYANMKCFHRFRKLTLIYFTALSYTETCHRLERVPFDPGFLLSKDPRFVCGLDPLLDQAMEMNTTTPSSQDAVWTKHLFKVLEPYDLGGLTRADRQSHYPVLADDLYHAASKAGSTPGEMAAMLHRAGFFSDSTISSF